MTRLCRESSHTYLGRSFRHAMLQPIYHIYQSGYWYNKPGHTGTLSTDMSEEYSKDMANIVQFEVTQIVTGKKPARMNPFGRVHELDHWLRHRISGYWKQWRRCRKRVKELLKLGCSKRQAIFTALSRKSYWHLSKTLATQVGMTNQWLKEQGLISIKELWVSFHYPNKTR